MIRTASDSRRAFGPKVRATNIAGALQDSAALVENITIGAGVAISAGAGDLQKETTLYCVKMAEKCWFGLVGLIGLIDHSICLLVGRWLAD